MSEVQTGLLAYARILKLERELSVFLTTYNPDHAEAHLDRVRELIRDANTARRDGDAEYRSYIHACVTMSVDGIIPLF